MARALSVNDFHSYIQSHFSFHFTVYTAAARPTLLAMIEALWLQLGPWFRQCIEDANTAGGDANVIHKKIVASLRARDAKQVRYLLEQDIKAGMEFLRAA